MDIEQLYNDYNITYVTEGHKHARTGWINTACPFCVGENPGYHLGYDTYLERYICWRCGGHYVPNTLAELLNISKPEAYKLLKDYGAATEYIKQKKRKIRIKSFKYPSNLIDLQKNHKRYLIDRDFDPDELIKEWGIMGTGPVSILDKLNYKHRIIIPFIWDGKVVSFDSRDITNKSSYKYMACPDFREYIAHKEILYGKQEAWKKTGICVEGPTDVWRMGKYSFATSGINYTPKQLRIMSNTFKRIAVLFDDEPHAIIQAKKLVADLKFRGVDTFRIPIIGDPGALSQKEANYLVKQIIK